MIYFSKFAATLRRNTAVLSTLIATFFLVAAVSAASLDFNVPGGNYNVASNWIDSTTGLPASAPPTYVDSTTFDDAFVRNGGTLTINSDVSNHMLRIGAIPSTTGDYNGNGSVDAADYVLWRIGGTLLNDPTPGVQPEDYDYWRARFGNGGNGAGTLIWTAGKITGASGPVPQEASAPFTYYGPDVRLGQHVNINGTTQLVERDFPGTVTQNGPTTELNLLSTTSVLNIGDSGASTTPTSTYNLVDGTIAVVVTYVVPFVGSTQGTNGNSGINVKSGNFNMSGGRIIDRTVEVSGQTNPSLDTQQRWLTIASGSGSGTPLVLNYSTATFTGGTVDVLGGLRVATGSNSRGFLNISGTAAINMGNEISVGYNVTNGVGVMNMSGGQFTTGSNMQIGHRGNGTLNLSGGIVTIGSDLRVGSQTTSPDSLVNMTGGTLTTKNIKMQIQPPGLGGTPTILIDGPTANFTQGPNGGTDTATIGAQGPAIFEVRQGQASLHQIQLGQVNTNGTTASGTINVKGGKLKITGPVLKSDPNATSTVNLTAGILEITPKVAGAESWGLDFSNTGSEIILNPNVIQQVTVSNTSATPNFSMSSGKWDIEIGSNANASGADRFIVSGGGTASLTGGTLNISRINGYTPAVNDTLTILQGASATLTAGAVTLAGDPGWGIRINPSDSTQIQLYRTGTGSGLGAVPEPSAVVLFVFAQIGLFAVNGRRYWSRA
jgi:hypothetical protein